MDRTAWRILREHRDIIHVKHLPALGLTRAGLRWKVRSGRWRQVLPRVYATFTGRLTDQQRLIAAWLYAGPSAQIGAISALRMYGLRYLPPAGGEVHVLVPHRQRIGSVRFVRVHRTTCLDAAAVHNGVLLVCSPARAVVDTARSCGSLATVRAMLAQVVQEDMATVAQVRAELDRARRNGSGLLRTALEEVADGVRSVAEAALRDTLGRSKILPRIRWNPKLVAADGRQLPSPDGWIDEAGLALEVDSREFHISPRDWERTLARHNQLSRHGAQVLHFPPSQIRRARPRCCARSSRPICNGSGPAPAPPSRSRETEGRDHDPEAPLIMGTPPLTLASRGSTRSRELVEGGAPHAATPSLTPSSPPARPAGQATMDGRS